MLKIKSSPVKIDSVFILSLFSLFTITAIIVVIVGSVQFRGITATVSENHEVRSSSSYFREKLRQNNELDLVSLETVQDVDALALKSEINGTTYTTYIYYYDGWIRELLVSDTSVFQVSAGQPILESTGLSLELVTPQLLCVTFSDVSGRQDCIYVNLLSASEKEA